MTSEYNVIVNNDSESNITVDGYKTIARGLLNALGKDICLELVKQSKQAEKN